RVGGCRLRRPTALRLRAARGGDLRRRHPGSRSLAAPPARALRRVARRLLLRLPGQEGAGSDPAPALLGTTDGAQAPRARALRLRRAVSGGLRLVGAAPDRK